MVSRADKAARQAALQQLKKIWANKEAQNSKGAKFDGQLAEEQNIPVATGTKHARENDEERKPLRSGKRLKVAGSRVLQDKSTNKLVNRPSRQVVDKPKSRVQLEHKGTKQIRVWEL